MVEQNQQISSLISSSKNQIAASVVDQFWRPELEERFGATGREKTIEDVGYHLAYLSEAIAVDSITLFIQYLLWTTSVLEGLNISRRDLIESFVVINDVLQQQLPEHAHALVNRYLETGIHHLKHTPAETSSYIDVNEPLGKMARTFLDLLLAGQRREASRLVLDAVESGVSVKDIYLNVFQKSQQEVGRLWQTNQVSVAQEHFITAATQMIMSQLYPHIFSTHKNNRRLVATCVGGELHEIGIRMVADFFEMEGWDTYYLGANVPVNSIIATIAEQQANVLAVSATMTFHVSSTAALIEQVRTSSDIQNVKILVGGYPFNLEPDLWQKVGASGYATNAQKAVQLADQLVANGAA